MKKLISLLLLLTLTMSLPAYAKRAKTSITGLIKESGIPASSISISVKNTDNGKKLYSLNESILLPPASVQKAITIVPIADALGNDYQLATKIYARGNNSYIIKLGADPYLTHGDLEALVSVINKETVKKIYIDDSIVEKKDWGEGWQWDDDLNPAMPRFNAYNLDKNLIKITVMPTEPGQQALLINPSKYPFAFYNNVITDIKNEVKFERDYDANINKVILSGFVNSPQILTIPNNNLKRYFCIKLKEALAEKEIYLKEPFTTSKLEPTDVFLTEVNHQVSDAIKDILVNSNNMSIESLSKIAASVKYHETGTDTEAIRLFNDYCAKNGIDNSSIKIVDASGVSKNNLMNADFISEYLFKNKDNAVFEQLPHAGEGTLANRMTPLSENLRAKTGTLSGLSSIAGFLTTKKGNSITFCIIINDPNSKPSAKKALEDYIIRELYTDM